MPEILTKIQEIKKCRYGNIFYLKNDLYLGCSFDKYGEWSQAGIDLLQKFIKKDDWILDIGASIGSHSLFFSRNIGESGLVLSFEPQRKLFYALCTNISLNNLNNIRAYQMVVGEKTGIIKVPSFDFIEQKDYSGLSLTEAYPDGEDIAATTIDSLGISKCNLIKANVEGMENQVLEGAVKTIIHHRPVLYLANNLKERSPQLLGKLNALDYRVYWHTPPFYNFNNYFQDLENIFGDIVSVNLLCIPEERVNEYQSLLENYPNLIKYNL